MWSGRRGWLATTAALGVVALLVLFSAATVLADYVVNPFAGNWSTFSGSGTLRLQVVNATKGQQAVAFYSGGSGSCASQTVYYTGAYSVSSDSGQIAGCTNAGGRHLMGWYKSDAGPQHGTISIGIGSFAESFSGTYNELSNPAPPGAPPPSYSGAFTGDFPNSGRTSPSPPPSPPPPPGGPCDHATITALSGDAGVFHVNAFDWIDLHVGDRVVATDDVHTGMESSITLGFCDGSKVVISEMTQAKINSLLDLPNRGKILLLLMMGELKAQIVPKEVIHSDFSVKSPTATVSVRGTVLSVFYDPSSGTTIVDAIERSVLVTPTNLSLRPLTLRPGTEVAVTKHGVSRVVGIGKAGAPPGSVNRERAYRLLVGVGGPHEQSCGFTATMTRFALKPTAHGWLASLNVRGGVSGTATWKISGHKITPRNSLARLIARGCAGVVPNLTGAWQPNDPASPRWKLTSGAKHTTLRATWHGGRGHFGLVGSFSGTLSSDRTHYHGTLHITEGSLHVTGTMTFKITTANSLHVTYHQTNGVSGTFTLKRAFG